MEDHVKADVGEVVSAIVAVCYCVDGMLGVEGCSIKGVSDDEVVRDCVGVNGRCWRRWGCGTVGRGSGKWWEWEIPHGDFHAADKVAADAGCATALWEAAEEGSVDRPDIGDDVDVAVCKVLGCHFDVAFRGASRDQHGPTLVL